MAKRQAFFLRVLNVLKGGWQTPWHPQQIARQLDADVDACAKACSRLVKAGCVVAVGRLYQWVPASADPVDRRGKHGAHKKGAAWIAARKQRLALQRARAKRLAGKISAAAMSAERDRIMWV